MKKIIFVVILFFNLSLVAAVERIYCGFSETAEWPSHNIVVDNPGSAGAELIYHTSYGDTVFVLLTTMENIPNPLQTDITILIQTSQAGGFIEASARGLVESPQKWNGVATQTPLNRKDQGLYFVRVSCGI